jgi:hypothetical protein
LPKGHRRLHSDSSVLLEAEAPPDAIVFAPALHVNGYAVDRRRLRNVRVLERFTRWTFALPDGWPRAPRPVWSVEDLPPWPLTAIADR